MVARLNHARGCWKAGRSFGGAKPKALIEAHKKNILLNLILQQISTRLFKQNLLQCGWRKKLVSIQQKLN